MNDRLLDRITNRGSSNGVNDSQSDDEHEVDDLGSFGFLRGSKERATMMELRRKDGNILAVAYGYMDKAAFDPSDGITLHHAGKTIQIKGRNLNVEVHPKVRLFEAICRHRVPWIQEAGEPENFEAREGATVIVSIEW